VGGWADESTPQGDVPVPKPAVVPRASNSSLEEIDRFLASAGSDPKSESLKRAAAYKELNSPGGNQAGGRKLLQQLDGVDLRLLGRHLLSEEQTSEPDTPWNWDVLFAEMAADLQKEDSIK